jgi:hypothetical protein
MSFISALKNMEHRFPWSFSGFILAVILGGVTVYLGFYKETKPNLSFVITSNSSVLDIKENLGNLDVLYQGSSLSKSNQDLKIITFKVINQGDAAILPNFYDPNDPIGFSITGGTLADEPNLIKASNNYLKEKLIIKHQPDNIITFSNVILEPNEFFEIKVLILHDTDKSPSIEAVGKIAGSTKIEITEVYTQKNQQSFIKEVLGGGIYTNTMRLLIYGFSGVLILFFIVWSIITFQEKLEKYRKNLIIRTFKDYDNERITDKDDYFFRCYLDRSPIYLMEIHRNMINLQMISINPIDSDNTHRRRFYPASNDHLTYELQQEGIVVLDKETQRLTVDENSLKTLTDFISYLKRKGKIKKNQDPSEL